MKEEQRTQLLLYEEKNAKIFQVMGSLKLMNIKVKSFVKRLESVEESDTKKMKELQYSFREICQDIQFFDTEHAFLNNIDVHVPSVDTFARNSKRMFVDRGNTTYTLKDMRQISVYLYRMADIMLKDLRECKLKNEEEIHEINAHNGKYYFNRK